MTHRRSRDPVALYSGLKLAAYFRRSFARVGTQTPKIRVRYSDAGHPPQDVLIERQDNQFTLVIASTAERDFARFIRKKMCAYAYWLSLCPPVVKRITVNASDGHVVSDARFAASVRFPRHIALPDPHFYDNDGFSAERDHGKAAPSWHARSDDIVWRGAMHGAGWVSFSPEDGENPAVVQRIRMAMRLNNVPGTDVRFVNVPRSEATFALWALTQGLVGEPIAAQNWLGRKFAIDIDGYTNTWSNLLIRMLFGCCVLKVSSQFGFRQWYYDELKPFEHYVPVKADMSDLLEQIAWVRSHDAEAKAIAERGQALARTLTFPTQARRAAGLIESHWDRVIDGYAATETVSESFLPIADTALQAPTRAY